MTDSIYEIILLGGDETTPEWQPLRGSLHKMLKEFELEMGSDVSIRTAATFDQRNPTVSTVGIFFAGNPDADNDAVRKLLKFNIPTIPVLKQGMDFESSIPKDLNGANGVRLSDLDAECLEAASGVLECLGLLRRQRRVFVSYRRSESRAAAVQLHDELSSAGFDVFLDTHDIRPGDNFQDELWHRLCDSDVMVMLDTPEYFERKWTRTELAKAQAKEIHILRIVWPDHKTERKTDVGQTIFLEKDELSGVDGPIIEETVNQIVRATEMLRSRSIAARHMSITGKLKSAVECLCGSVDAIGAHRSIRITLESGRRFWAYPVVGVPTAATLNDIVEKSINAGQSEAPILVYDHVGLRDKWTAHLKWLNDQIGVVDAVRISQAAWDLADLEAE